MGNCCLKFPKLPCLKFIIAAFTTTTILAFAIVMLILNRDETLKPFYSSLVSGVLSYWCHPPSSIENNNNNNNVEL